MRTQDRLQDIPPALFVEYIVGSGQKQESRKWGVSDKSMRNDGGRTRAEEMKVTMF